MIALALLYPLSVKDLVISLVLVVIHMVKEKMTGY
jgi:hypothetical protein